MPKLSPTTKLVAIVGLILIVYMAYQDLSPAPTPPPHHLPVATQTAAADGILPEDLNAHYARYTGGKRDPFLPVVFPPNSGGQGDLSGVGKHGGWTLTGINQVDGVSSALVENDSTGDSEFLQTGDHWNGLKVVSISDEAVRLENAFGQQTELKFPPPPEDTSTTSPSSVPSLGQIAPLPGLGTDSTTGAQPAPAAQPAIAPQGGFGGRRRFGNRGGFGAPSY